MSRVPPVVADQFTVVPVPRSLRPLGIAIAIGLHVLAFGALAAGAMALASIALIATGSFMAWGSLNPRSRLFGAVLCRLPVGHERVVWLTFDDGPSDDTPALIELLAQHGARATFFLVGERAAAHSDHVRALLVAGHDIGNHSQRHLSARFWSLPPRVLRREIEQAQTTLTRIAGRAPRWFRAVAGHSNPFVDPVLSALGLARASWSARGFDSVDDDDQRVLARLVRGISPGAVLMLHEDPARPGRSVRLAGLLLEALAARGYRTVLAMPESASAAPARLAASGAATNSQLLNGVRPHRGLDTTVSPSASSSAVSPARVG